MTEVNRMEKPWGKGRLVWGRDATANDSDKTVITVGTGKVINLLGVTAILACTATVGTRYLWVEISNETPAVVWQAKNITALTASQTGTYVVAAAAGIGTSATAGWNILPNPTMLLAGYTVRVYDSAAIDAAADDLTVYWTYIEYDV